MGLRQGGLAHAIEPRQARRIERLSGLVEQRTRIADPGLLFEIVHW
jgi:hypothetical protein